MEPDDGTNKRRGSLSYHNEDCTVIKDTTEWNDMNCNDRHMFICKKPIIKPGGKDVEWRPVYANSLVKLNQNIPYEEFTEKHNDTCGDMKSNICGSTSSSSSDSKQSAVDDTSAVVMPGGNGGSSQIHLTSPSLTNDVDEQETLTTGQAIIRVPSSYHHRHDDDTATESQSNSSVAHTGVSEEMTQSLKSNTSSASTFLTASNGEIGNQDKANHEQYKASSQQSNSLPLQQQQQQQQDGNAVAALNKAVKEIEQEQEIEMRKGLSALNSIDNLVDNLKNQYNKSKDESSGHQLGITIDPPSSMLPQHQQQPQQTIIDGLADPAEVRKKILAVMKQKLSTPMINAQPLTLAAMAKPDASQLPADSVVKIELSKQSPNSDEHTIPTSSSLSTFKPNPKTVETICKDSCKKDIDGCMESCRNAVAAMNPVEFLRTLQTLNHRASDVSSIDQTEASDRAQSGERRETSKGYTSESKDTGGSLTQDNVEGVSMIKPNHVAAGKIEGQESNSMLNSIAGFVGRDSDFNNVKTHNDGFFETLRTANDHQGRRRNHRHQRNKKHHHEFDSDENLTEISSDKNEKNEQGNSHQDQIEQNSINNDEGPLYSDTSHNEQPDKSAMDQMGDKWSSRNVDEGSESIHQEEVKDWRNPSSSSKNNEKDDSRFGSHIEDMYMEQNDLAKEFLKHPDSSNYENFNHESESHKEDLARDEEEIDLNHGKNRNSKYHEKSSKHKEEEESEEEDELLKSGKYINSKHHKYHESLGKDSSEDKGRNNKTEGGNGFVYRPLDIHIHSVGRDEFPYHLPEPMHYNSIEEALKANPDINDGGASHYLQDPGQHQHALEPDQSTVGNGVKPTIKQFSDKLYVGPDMNTEESRIHDEHSSSHLEDSFPPREFDNHDARETVENHRSRESGYSRTSETKDSQSRESKDFQDSQTKGNNDFRTNGFSPDAPVVELHLGEVEKDKNPHGVSEDSTTPANLHQPVSENHRFGSLANELKHRRLENHLAGMRNGIGGYRKTNRNIHQINREISSTGNQVEREFLSTRHRNLYPLDQKTARDRDFLAPQQGKYDSSNRSRKNNRWHESNDEKDLEEVAKAKSLVMEFKKLRKQLKDTYHSLSNGHV